MNDIPFGFVIILLGFIACAFIFAIAAFVVKQKRVQRLKDPRKDYYRHKKG